MRRDLSELREQALDAVRSTETAHDVADITLEQGEDNDGWQFLRVMVQLKAEAKPTDDDLLALQDAVQDRLIDLDERFPSVRFPDAA